MATKAAKYPGTRRAPRNSPRTSKTVRRRTAANQNKPRAANNNYRGSAKPKLRLGGLVGHWWRSYGGYGIALGMLIERTEPWRFWNPETKQPQNTVPSPLIIPPGEEIPAGWDLSGWTEVHNCTAIGGGPNSEVTLRPCGSFGVESWANWTAAEGQLRKQTVGANETFTAAFYDFYEPHPTQPVNYMRYQVAQIWQITQPSSDPDLDITSIQIPAQAGSPAMNYAPFPYETLVPSIDPLSHPAFAPEATPLPIPYRYLPYRRPNPYRAPEYQPVWGPGPEKKEWVIPVHALPVDAKAVLDIGTGKPARPEKPFHERRPPGKREKEWKGKLYGPAYRAIINVVNKITETEDFIDVLYDALPSNVKPRYKNTKYERKKVLTLDKALIIYRHADKLDMDKVITGLIYEHIEDRFYGAIGKAHIQLARDLGLPVTLQNRIFRVGF